MAKLFHIGMLTFLAIGYIFATWLLYNEYKKKTVNGKRLMDEPVNKNTRTDKMGIGEIIIYLLMFVIAILIIVLILYKGTMFLSASAILIRSIILVPIMAFFNARKRTGKAMVTLFASHS